MLDTFKENLAKAQSTEASALENDNSFMKVKNDNYDEMKDTFDQNESQMGSNDESLSTKRGSLEEAENTLADDSEFLAKLTPICKTKERDFETRKMIRSNEEAAVAQAIAVLNSDAATESFGKAGSTKLLQKNGAASFLQTGAATRHSLRA